MVDDDKIPVLTDLIEPEIEQDIDITQPEIGLDPGHDMVIDQDDEPQFAINQDALKPTLSKTSARLPNNPQLEQTIRRILDEHLELAWQEIRLAIQLSMDDEDPNH